MKPVIVHDAAEFELWQAIDFYEAIRKGLGLDLEEEIRHALAGIQEVPEVWPKKKHGTRYRLLARFPFAIYYLDLRDNIWVVAFAHTSRKPYYWRDRI
jgi:plasmid stabilization system protein ParE